MAQLRWLACALLLWAAAGVVNAKVPQEIRDSIRFGDYERAEQLLKSGAARGDSEYQYQLARLYDRGLIQGVASSEAQHWYEAAASSGHANARKQLERYQMERRKDERLPDAPKHTQCSSAAVPVGEAAFDWLAARIACAGFADWLEAARTAGFDMRHRGAAGNTLLHFAVSARDVSAVQLLLREGISADARNDQGWSPRMLAERGGNTQIMAEFGISSGGQGVERGQIKRLGETLFPGWTELSVAAWHGAHEAMQHIIVKGADVNAVGANGKTALERALQKQDAKAISLLLEAGALLQDIPLELIVDQKHQDVSEQLWNGARQEGLEEALGCASLARTDLSPMDLIVTGGSLQSLSCEMPVAVMLVRKKSPERFEPLLSEPGIAELLNQPDKRGCTALCWSLRTEQPVVAQRLIEAGSLNTLDAKANSTLMLAAQRGYQEVVELLLSNNAGYGVDHQNKTGGHALLLAASAGHHKVVDALLQQGAAVDLMDKMGNTALIGAVNAGKLAAAKRLLEGGASLYARNHRSENAFDLIEAKGDAQWQELIRDGRSFWSVVR